MSRYSRKTSCAKSGCENVYFPDKWGKMEAAHQGWFIQWNGDAWCPEHIPNWVAEWRARKSSKEN